MNKKKILAGILAAVIIVGAICGITVGVKASRRSTVLVVQAGELNYGGYWDYSSQMEGIISSDVSQDIYLTDTQTVSQVMVKEGDQVKEGDILLSYDTTLTNLNLEREKLNRDQINLKLQVAQENLKKLKNMKPSSGGSSGGVDFPGFEIPEDPIEPEPEPTVTPTEAPKNEFQIQFHSNGHGKAPASIKIQKGQSFQAFLDQLKEEEKKEYLLTADGYIFAGWYTDPSCTVPYDLSSTVTEDLHLYAKWTKAAPDYSDVTANAELKADTAAYNENPDEKDDSLGLVTNPYRYLCTDQAVIQADFMNSLREKARKAIEKDPKAHYYFMLEVHEGDTVEGKLLKGWMQDAVELAKQEQDFPENWQGVLNLSTGNIDVSRKANPTQAEGTAVSLKTKSVMVKDLGAGSGGLGLITGDMGYTKEELEREIRTQEEEIKSLQLDLKESELNIQQAEKAVTDGVVRAKLSGVVKKVGDPKNPPKDGSPFLQLNGTEGLYVKGGLNELMLGEIQEGDTVSVMSWQSGTMCEAVIKEISPYPDESGMFGYGGNASYYLFTAYIASGGDNLTNQEWVQITVDGNAGSMKGNDDTLYLWKAFIREEDGEKYVYMRGENGRLKKQVITVGKLSGEGYEIKSGVTADDWVAFPYGKDVKNGAKTKEGTTSDLYGY